MLHVCRNRFTGTQNLETLIRSKYNTLIRAHVSLTYDRTCARSMQITTHKLHKTEIRVRIRLICTTLPPSSPPCEGLLPARLPPPPLPPASGSSLKIWIGRAAHSPKP